MPVFAIKKTSNDNGRITPRVIPLVRSKDPNSGETFRLSSRSNQGEKRTANTPPIATGRNKGEAIYKKARATKTANAFRPITNLPQGLDFYLNSVQLQEQPTEVPPTK